MRWSGNDTCRELTTHDGYHLKAELVETSRYWWAIYRNSKIIDSAIFKKDFTKTIRSAQSKARHSLIRHLIKQNKTN